LHSGGRGIIPDAYEGWGNAKEEKGPSQKIQKKKKSMCEKPKIKRGGNDMQNIGLSGNLGGLKKEARFADED